MTQQIFDQLCDMFTRLTGDDPDDAPGAFLYMCACIMQEYAEFIKKLKDEIS